MEISYIADLTKIGRAGELRLSFAYRNGKTTLRENYSQPPLQVMRAIPDTAGCLCVYLLSPSGGVLQDDRYTMQILLGAKTHALFTTPSATRIYRMPVGYAEQTIFVTIEQDAIFEFIPEAVILFADSDFRQAMNVTLHPGSLLILHEIIMPGRLTRGEYLQFRKYQSQLIVRDTDGLILFDAANITPADQDLTQTGVLEGFPCWGSLYILGDLQRWKLDADAFCQHYSESISKENNLVALSPLHRSGICVRMMSHQLEPIYTAFNELRQAIRTCIGLPDEKLRK